MIYEMAVALFDSHGGIEEGDVVVCRKPIGGIGSKEISSHLWGLADISEQLIKVITRPLLDAEGNKVKKRRFKIPLDAIVAMDPEFDVLRARDSADIYQPYLGIDSDLFFSDVDPQTFELETMQIVWDKSIGEYI